MLSPNHLLRSLGLVFSLAAGLSLAACKPRDDHTLTVIGEAVPTTQALSDVSADYRDNGNKVSVEQFDFDTAVQRATLDVTSGQGHYDIILQPHLSLGRFVDNGLLVPVSEIISEADLKAAGLDPQTTFFPGFWRELAWYKGKAYGFPFVANTMYVAYRKDWFADANNRSRFRTRYGYDLAMPQTWQEYEDVAAFFTDASRGTYGTALQARRHEALWYEWLNFAYSFGGGVLRSEHAADYGPIIINCPETVLATRYYRGLLAYAPPDTTNYTWDEQLAAVQAGKIAMAVMWSDVVPSLEDTKTSRVAGRMAYGLIPMRNAEIGHVSQIAGWSFLIPKTSKHKAAAAKYILWALQREQQVAQQRRGSASPVRSTYSDPQVARLPYTAAYLASVEGARSMSPSFPESPEVSNTVQVCLSSIMAGTRTVEQGLNDCASRLQTVLASHYKSRPDGGLVCPLKP